MQSKRRPLMERDGSLYLGITESKGYNATFLVSPLKARLRYPIVKEIKQSCLSLL